MVKVEKSRDTGCHACWDHEREGGTKPAYKIIFEYDGSNQSETVSLCADCIEDVYVKFLAEKKIVNKKGKEE